MEITNDNFLAELDAITQAISTASYVSLDCEFTGLDTSADHSIKFFDSPQERYSKSKQSCSSFTVTQFGLTTFTWSADTLNYVCKTYNFYIFPLAQTASKSCDHEFKSIRQSLERSRVFSCQASSLLFLADHAFDFNKWVRKGIPYLNRTDEDRIRRARTEKQSIVETEILLTEDKDIEFLDDAINQIQAWLADENTNDMQMNTPSSFHTKVIHQQVKKRFDHVLGTERLAHNSVLIKKLGVNERAQVQNDHKFEQALNEMIGFRKIIDIISAYKKPIVGHNMLLDLCHIIHHFHQDLPESLDEFKQLVNNLFPKVYDTKFMCKKDEKLNDLIPRTTLSDLSSRMQESPFLFPKNKPPYLDTSTAYHEAGYDAWITGNVFSKITANILGIGNAELIKPLDLEVLDERFCSRVFLMRSDYEFLDLRNDEVIPNRQHIFHLHSFPSTTQQSRIQMLFKPFGRINLVWNGTDSCFVGLKDVERHEECFRALKRGKDVEDGEEVFGYEIERWSEFDERCREGKNKKRKRED